MLGPIRLAPNPVTRFYRGGPSIARFRGMDEWDEYAPEDWVGSATTAFGSNDTGLTRLADGLTLPRAMSEDPHGFLGPDHFDAFGPHPGLLVKLLDAAERLPVHLHPDREFARSHLASPYGKTEAWIVVDAAPGAAVHVGFRRDVGTEELRTWVADQDASAMLAALHRVPVETGSTFLVPAGMPHAIGEGVFLVELQEPTDFSVLLEWRGFDIDGSKEGHLGLGFDVALGAVDRGALGEEHFSRLSSGRGRDERRTGVEVLFPAEADPFFRAERVVPEDSAALDAAFSILVVTEGEGLLSSRAGTLALAAGQTVLVPYAAGECRAEGELVVIRCRPPAEPPPV